MARIIAILALVPLLGACATIVEGTSQEFIVNVSPDSAYCQLTRKGVPISSINGGKNLITLEKSRNDIIFDCTAPGYEQELIKIESSATGWGVVGCIFIDLCITDYSTGALNSYADSVNISLKRKGQGDAVLGNATLAPPLDATWRSISISSNPPQASCQLINNGRVVGYVQTPGAIQIENSNSDMVVTCTKRGYVDAAATLVSELDDNTLEITDQNGGTGWAVDTVVGADNQNSDHVRVSLVQVASVPVNAAVLAPPLAAAWRTINNNVLAFSEPDDSGESIAMPSYVQLSLIKQRNEWGLFEYQSGGAMRAQAWIAMMGVTQLE